MTTDDPYNAWKQLHSQVDVGDRFADRIMERIAKDDSVKRHQPMPVAERGWRRFAWCLHVSAAVFIIGLGVGILRVGSMVILLLLITSKGH